MSGMSGTTTTRDLMARLPHRYPFLLIDRIEELDPGTSVRAIKNVTVNEPHFAGHFPGNPIMPGVLILEAMAQAGGQLFDIGDRLCVLARIDIVRFRNAVIPGDRLILDARAIATLASMGKVEATATVDDRIVASADITYSFLEGRTA